uniref:Uncharacterized protein n=1 Tax=Anguilla anguilla TaxID=7936 RepID=A0A0E9SSJ1_ANGAN
MLVSSNHNHNPINLTKCSFFLLRYFKCRTEFGNPLV